MNSFSIPLYEITHAKLSKAPLHQVVTVMLKSGFGMGWFVPTLAYYDAASGVTENTSRVAAPMLQRAFLLIIFGLQVSRQIALCFWPTKSDWAVHMCRGSALVFHSKLSDIWQRKQRSIFAVHENRTSTWYRWSEIKLRTSNVCNRWWGRKHSKTA